MPIPINGIILIFLIALIVCWWFKDDIYEFFNKNKKSNTDKNDSEDKKE